ncbi:uncharacterized protein LOC131307239 [Rhododendron vialii]|uniref:uncharacterized protein LOC131307239 n=1 Tax=Rhododendron vialii TaxID=182163 RepID=UPI00265EDFEC|nr:uncharacterized protein LOC131307239 [Rhododendron vialii]XP_058189637.1 uncharacterized protein LOC131307239 [Rhododendron vialii]
MKQQIQRDATPATSRSAGGRSGWRRKQTPPPPSPQERPHETGHRGSVKDRLGIPPDPGDAREIILYKRHTTSGTHRSKSHHDRTNTRDTESFTSTYSTGRAEFSRTTVSHCSRDSVETRRHVSERLGKIPAFDNNNQARRNGKGVRIEEPNNETKSCRDGGKSVDGHHRATVDLRDKLRHRNHEKSLDRDSKRTKMDEHGKPPRPGFERQLKDLGVSPFMPHIINMTAEPNFHLPKFTKFDPITCEAYTHLIHFRQTIELCTTKDKIKCKAFPSSLDSLGLQWLYKLPAGSIRNLANFECAFNTRFITSNRTAKEPESLSQMRKLPSETLRQYTELYWQLFNKIPGIDEYWAVRTFKNGLEINSKILDEAPTEGT